MTTVTSIFGMTSIAHLYCRGLKSYFTIESRLTISRLRRRHHGTIRQLPACGIGLLEARHWTSKFRRSQEMRTSKPRGTPSPSFGSFLTGHQVGVFVSICESAL